MTVGCTAASHSVETGSPQRVSGVTISTIGWIVVGVAAWLVVSVIVGVLIGRMVRLRDQQVPRKPVDDRARRIPMHRTYPDEARFAGRRRPRDR